MTTTTMNKSALFTQGCELMERFCRLNLLPIPVVNEVPLDSWMPGTCAYYRKATGITICVPRCAAIGKAGRAWSYPGYTVDRTPYGVIQHELGHHADMHKGTVCRKYWSNFSKMIRKESRERPVTSYCPNDAEWFAEVFRVFVTNPGLLRLVRPKAYGAIREHFHPVFSDDWRVRLRGAPERTIAAAQRQIERAS